MLGFTARAQNIRTGWTVPDLRALWVRAAAHIIYHTLRFTPLRVLISLPLLFLIYYYIESRGPHLSFSINTVHFPWLRASVFHFSQTEVSITSPAFAP
jgi:hypothetical protein